MKKINEDIKNDTYSNIYLLCGEEEYLKAQYKDKLKQAIIGDEDGMNYTYYEGKGIDTVDLIETANTLPFFADRRLIVIENSSLLKSAPEGLADKFLELPDSTYIVMVENEVDKRSKLYKRIKEKGYISEMNTPDAKMLVSWVGGICNKENKKISEAAANHIVEYIGSDMSTLKNELDKLFAYTIDRDVITIDDINEVCISQATNKIFDMLDAIGNKNQARALLLYRDLLTLREPAMRILYLLTKQFDRLLQIRCLLDSNKQSIIAATVGVPPFSVKKYVAQANKYDYKRLKSMLDKCQDTEQGIKTGRIVDVIGVELLIVEFSS